MSIEWKMPPQEPEGIRWSRAFAIIAGTLVVFATGVGVVWVMGLRLAHDRDPFRPRIPEELSERTINLLEQVPFPIATYGESLRDSQLHRLDGYGWVDRVHGIVHMPVEWEMERMVSEQDKGPGGVP